MTEPHRAVALPTNIGWCQTNTLAYFQSASLSKEKVLLRRQLDTLAVVAEVDEVPVGLHNGDYCSKLVPLEEQKNIFYSLKRLLFKVIIAKV